MNSKNRKKNRGPIPNNKNNTKDKEHHDSAPPEPPKKQDEIIFDNLEPPEPPGGNDDTTFNNDSAPPKLPIENGENIFDDPGPPKQDNYGEFEQEGPPGLDKREYELNYHNDRSYLFIFGPASSGKTVIISSILYYLRNTRSIQNGDTLKNLNDSNLKHEKEGNKLWKELSTTIFENKFPKGTMGVKLDNPFPRHINAHFLPSEKNNSDFKFCFMDMSGEDLEKVDHDSEHKLPESIRIYVEQMPKNNICFLYTLDPRSDRYSKSEQLNIFNAFIDLLDQNEHTDTPLLFIVTKWDIIKNEFDDVEEFIKQEYLPIWGVLNQNARNISFAEFSIGEVSEDNVFIKKYNPFFSEKAFNWFYQKQTGTSLIGNPKKQKQGFFDKNFKK